MRDRHLQGLDRFIAMKCLVCRQKIWEEALIYLSAHLHLDQWSGILRTSMPHTLALPYASIKEQIRRYHRKKLFKLDRVVVICIEVLHDHLQFLGTQSYLQFTKNIRNLLRKAIIYFPADTAAIIFIEKLKDLLKALNINFSEFVDHRFL